MARRARPGMKAAITAVVTAAVLATTVVGAHNAAGNVAAQALSSAPAAAGPGSVHDLSTVPASVRTYYEGFWFFAKVMKNPYLAWTPPKAPWRLCYNESYLGNAWRQEALAEYQKLVAQYKKAGLARGDLIVTNSDNAIGTQLSQLNSLVREGCTVIISVPGSPTGLCSGVKNARDHGVLVITDESPVYCPEAINVTFNDYWAGQMTGGWIAQALHGKGNVVLINGIPGLSDTVAERQGVLDTFKKYPGIKVIGEVTGMWTPSIAKSAMIQWLATHPQRVDAVWNSGQSGVAAAEALAQEGRPPAKINGFSGSCSLLAYWKQHHWQSFSLSQGGGPALYETFEVALRMLNGQQPAVNTLMYPVPQITPATFNQYYKPSMTIQSSCFANPADGRAVPDSYFDVLFKGGKPVSPAPKA